MILTRTPLRISLFGGGTDLPAFCSQYTGHVLTGAINKYIYIALKKRFDGRTRACYSITELVDDPADLKHDLIRAAFTKAKISGVDVASFSDVQSNGTGLGSSSAFTVGLIHAIYAMRGIQCEKHELAAEACKIEINRCRKPIGRQDQYATAMGGVRQLTFQPGQDLVETYEVSRHSRAFHILHDQMLLFHTGIERDGDSILAEQSASTPAHFDTLKAMAQMADDAAEHVRRGMAHLLGPMLHNAWKMKKSLASGISTPQIDCWYDTAIEAGAAGGKILGAGGGGYMLFLASPNRHARVIDALPDLKHVPFEWDYDGTQVVYREALTAATEKEQWKRSTWTNS